MGRVEPLSRLTRDVSSQEHGRAAGLRADLFLDGWTGGPHGGGGRKHDGA
jgi:hypothetical protein